MMDSTTMPTHYSRPAIKVHCRTSLDLGHAEEWPTELPTVPSVGDMIQSKTLHKQQPHGHFRLRLKVVSITWEFGTCPLTVEEYWFPVIELHDYWPEPRSIKQFFEWYAPLIGRTVASFI